MAILLGILSAFSFGVGDFLARFSSKEVGFKNYEISTTALRAEMVGHCSAMFKYGILNDKISPSRIIRDFNSLRYQYCALKHIKSNPQSGDEIILNAFIN